MFHETKPFVVFWLVIMGAPLQVGSHYLHDAGNAQSATLAGGDDFIHPPIRIILCIMEVVGAVMGIPRTVKGALQTHASR